MQFDGAAFNKHGFKRLNAEAVQRRRTVEHDRVIFNDNLEHIPYLSADAFHHALCALNVMGKAIFHELLHHEGFKELKRHFLRQAALVHFEFRADDDNAAAGIVYALAQKVLAEAALLAA